MNPYVIILNGKPCTGKTYFGNKLSNDLNLTYVARDEFKEMLFDDLGISDSEWSKKLGGASYSILFKVLEKLLKTSKSFILESNFNPQQHQQFLNSILERYGYNSFEIFLETEPTVLFQRYKARWNSGDRHRGHADDERFEEFGKKLKEDILLPLKLDGKIIKIDTTNFDNVNYDSIREIIIQTLSN